MGDVDGCIDDPHDELGIVPILAGSAILVQVVAYPDVRVVYEIIFSVVDSVDLSYCVPHAGGPSGGSRLGI